VLQTAPAIVHSNCQTTIAGGGTTLASCSQTSFSPWQSRAAIPTTQSNGMARVASGAGSLSDGSDADAQHDGFFTAQQLDPPWLQQQLPFSRACGSQPHGEVPPPARRGSGRPVVWTSSVAKHRYVVILCMHGRRQLSGVH